MQARHSFVALASLLLVLGACSSGDGGTEPTPTPTMAITATPDALTIVQGQGGTVQLALVRGGGFAGNVTLAASGAPAGVTAAVSPSPLPGNATSATVTVSTTSAVAPGTYPITITASAAGLTGVSDAFQLTIGAVPTFTLTPSNASLAVNAGGSVQTNIDIARTNLAGAVALALDEPLPGFTGTFEPASPTSSSSQLTLNVASQVAPGTYPLTIKGVSGTLTRTTTVGVTVSAAPTFVLSTTGTPVAIVAGNSGTATITLTRTNFSGAVALALQTPPAGISATFAPATTNGNTSTATISVAGSVAGGNYSLTVQGTGTVGTRTTTIPITVSVPVQPTMVEWMHCEPSETAIWFAFRDGDGPWTRVMPTTANGITRVSFPVLSTTASLAYTVEFLPPSVIADAHSTSRSRLRGQRTAPAHQFQQQKSYRTEQYHFLTSEAATFGTCVVPPSTTTLGVTINGLLVGQRANVAGTVGWSPLFLNTNPTHQLFATTGISDFWTIRQNTNAPTGFASELRRAITPPGPMTIDATAMLAATTATATLTGVSGNAFLNDNMFLATSRGTLGPAVVWAQQPNSSRMMFAHPTSQAGDMYSYHFHLIESVGNNNFGLIGTYWLGSTVANRTIAMHPAAPAPVVTTVSNNPVARLQVTGSIPATYNRSVSAIIWGDFVNNGVNRYNILATSGWLAAKQSAANYTLVMEDLSSAQWPVAAALIQPKLNGLSMEGANFTGSPSAGSFRLVATRALCCF